VSIIGFFSYCCVSFVSDIMSLVVCGCVLMGHSSVGPEIEANDIHMTLKTYGDGNV
jgi:hypothetical protein